MCICFSWEAKEAISVSGLQSIDDAAAGVENVDLTFMIDKVSALQTDDANCLYVMMANMLAKSMYA
jgi:hypothetical protein